MDAVRHRLCRPASASPTGFHYAWAVEDDTVLQVNAVGPFAITYARPEDDPRNAPATH